jgi:hypothetical protein
MYRILLTDVKSQLPSGWLKGVQPWNIWPMLSTFDVSQLPIGWLNPGWFANILNMVVTFDVSQAPIGSLKAGRPFGLNRPFMSVTSDVSQSVLI